MENDTPRRMPNVPPFVKFVCANVPMVFDDSLSYYEALCALWKYVQGMTDVINNNATLEEEYIEKFNELKEFVDNYFDDLDVQEEINNKLDKMVEDGTLESLINEEILGQIKIEINESQNPISYGADPTGVEDSTTAINDCIAANKGKTVIFANGTYKISAPIQLPFADNEKVNIEGNGAILKYTGEVESAIFVGADRASDTARNEAGFAKSYINNLYVDCSGADVTNGVKIAKGYKDLTIDNVWIFRTVNGVVAGESTGSPCDLFLTNCLIFGKGSEYEGYGVILNCSDNYVNNCRIYGFRKGFKIATYATITDTHVLLRWAEQSLSNFDPYEPNTALFNEYYEQTCFAEVNSGCRFSGCYADSVYKFLEDNTVNHVLFNGGFYYNARHVKCSLFEISTDHPKISIINSAFNMPTESPDARIIKCTHTSGLFNNYSQIYIAGIEINGISLLSNHCDIALTGYPTDTYKKFSLGEDWYVAKVFANTPNAEGYISAELVINGYKYDCMITTATGSVDIKQYNASTYAANWSAGVVRDNNNNLYLCVKRNSGSATTYIDGKLKSSNNLLFPLNPVYNDSMLDSSRLLSNYTANTPTRILALKQVMNIVNSDPVE